jgi:threonyl-tRNA synthetase
MPEQITIRLPEGTEKKCPQGTSFLELMEAIGKRVPEDVVAVKVNGDLYDLRAPALHDASVVPLPFSSEEGREVYRHSSAHLMAQAVKRLFPGVHLAIGPSIEEGFYYDFDYEQPFTPEDLAKIEGTMKEIIRADLPILRQEMSREEAISYFRKKGEQYKVEIIQELSDPKVSLYEQGEFVDLCEGPHLPSTRQIGAFKLLSTAGAYWRGNEKNPMLQRIYGVSFPTQDELDAHLARLEEMKKRDHRKLGKELDLFSIRDEIGPGLVLWHPKGARIRRIIEDFWRQEHDQRDYDLVFTPHLARIDLWKRSGHLDFYKENMFSPIRVEEANYQIKPMNCPFHIVIYKSHLRSYRDLPIRLAEIGTVYRYERSGVLHGLMRVRGFTQDDAHIFCRPDQLEEEVLGVVDFTLYVSNIFGFREHDIYLSTRPEKAVGTELDWQKATDALESALKKKNLRYQLDPGAGVFYGPKIDIKIKDSLGRTWQCATIQVDFNLPQNFSIRYVGEDGREHQPIMVHRALMGSLERFMGVLVEHYAGAFPTWLAPTQVVVIPITERNHDYARQVTNQLKNQGIRVEADMRNEKMGFKIREAQLSKIPYMLITGEKEVKAGTVSVRGRKGGDLGERPLGDFITSLKEEIQTRVIE